MSKYKIEDCFSLRARIGWQGLRAEEFTDHGPYLVTGTDFVNGKIDWDTCYHVDEYRFKQDVGIQLREHDLLITKDGTIGKTAVVQDCPEKATLNSGVFVVRAINGNVVPKFLYYVLNSHQFDLFMRNILTGSTIKHLNQGHFYKFSFEAPDTKRQSKIAEVLTTVDEAIDKTRALIEKYKNIKVGMMQDLLGRGEIMTFASIAENITVKKKPLPFDVCLNMDCLDPGSGELLSIAESDLKSDKIVFQKGDVLFGKLRPYLRKYWHAEFDGLCSSEIMVFRASRLVRSKYLYHIISSESFVEYNSAITFGTRMPRTSWGIVSKYRIAIPSLVEQDSIIEIISAIDQKIQTERSYLAKLQSIKLGLMQDLLTNTVSVDALM